MQFVAGSCDVGASAAAPHAPSAASCRIAAAGQTTSFASAAALQQYRGLHLWVHFRPFLSSLSCCVPILPNLYRSAGAINGVSKQNSKNQNNDISNLALHVLSMVKLRLSVSICLLPQVKDDG